MQLAAIYKELPVGPVMETGKTAMGSLAELVNHATLSLCVADSDCRRIDSATVTVRHAVYSRLIEGSNY